MCKITFSAKATTEKLNVLFDANGNFVPEKGEDELVKEQQKMSSTRPPTPPLLAALTSIAKENESNEILNEQ